MNSDPVLPFDDEQKPFGHNSKNAPEAIRADFADRVAKFLKGADVWSKREKLDADLAPRAKDFVAGAKKLQKEADAARVVEKKPHADKVKEIDAHWGGVDTMIEKVIKLTTPKLTAFADEQRKLKEEEARIAREKIAEAERERQSALLAAAAATTESARITAEAAAEQAEKSLKTATREERQAEKPVSIASATGLARAGGLRKVWAVEVTDLTRAILYLKKTNERAFAELVTQLAEAERRAAPTIDGVKQIPEIPGIKFSFTEQYQ